MHFFSELERQVSVLRAALGEDLEASACPATMLSLGDDAVVRVLEAASALVKAGEAVRIAAAGVAAARSTRDAGHGGLAQTRGHRSPVSLVQEITGGTRADAVKQVRLGGALLDAGMPAVSPDADAGDAAAPVRAWHAGLGDALLHGRIGSAQHHAILHALGEPPVAGQVDCACAATGDDAVTCACEQRAEAEYREAWAAAADQLIGEAGTLTAEELGKAARTIRDVLDPDGAQRRFEERFEGRSFRTWRDADGIHHGTIVFDDLGHAWLRAIIDTALRPRRGGPRFVDPDEQAAADALTADPRSNDQLAYDLLIDTLRAGALADPDTVFGTRQAGVRIITTVDALTADTAGQPAVAMLEDGDTLPAWVAAQHACTTGTSECTLDRAGNPLYLGRDARTFTAKQTLALAIRDGGCRWPGCDRPPAYTEAHHIDPYADGGHTDIDRGILLCRFHHMNLHNNHHRITRDHLGDFTVHSPDGRPPRALPPPLPRRYAWGDLQPPPRRFKPAA